MKLLAIFSVVLRAEVFLRVGGWEATEALGARRWESMLALDCSILLWTRPSLLRLLNCLLSSCLPSSLLTRNFILPFSSCTSASCYSCSRPTFFSHFSLHCFTDGSPQLCRCVLASSSLASALTSSSLLFTTSLSFRISPVQYASISLATSAQLSNFFSSASFSLASLRSRSCVGSLCAISFLIIQISLRWSWVIFSLRLLSSPLLYLRSLIFSWQCWLWASSCSRSCRPRATCCLNCQICPSSASLPSFCGCCWPSCDMISSSFLRLRSRNWNSSSSSRRYSLSCCRRAKSARWSLGSSMLVSLLIIIQIIAPLHVARHAAAAQAPEARLPRPQPAHQEGRERTHRGGRRQLRVHGSALLLGDIRAEGRRRPLAHLLLEVQLARHQVLLPGDHSPPGVRVGGGGAVLAKGERGDDAGVGQQAQGLGEGHQQLDHRARARPRPLHAGVPATAHQEPAQRLRGHLRRGRHLLPLPLPVPLRRTRPLQDHPHAQLPRTRHTAEGLPHRHRPDTQQAQLQRGSAGDPQHLRLPALQIAGQGAAGRGHRQRSLFHHPQRGRQEALRRHGRYPGWSCVGSLLLGLRVRPCAGLEDRAAGNQGCVREAGSRADCAMRDKRAVTGGEEHRKRYLLIMLYIHVAQFVNSIASSQQFLAKHQPSHRGILSTRSNHPSHYIPIMNKHKTMFVQSASQKEEEGLGGLQERAEDGEEQAQLLKAELKQTFRGFSMVALRIEAYYWLYFFYAAATVCETIVLFGFDLIASCLNILLPKVGAGKIKRTSFFACIIVFGCSLIVQELDFLNLSYLYHFFRGQNTVKLYSVGLSIMIFEIMLTTTGKTYLGKLPKILLNSDIRPSEVGMELVVSFLYSLVHFFIIYIDFVLFVIILNSSPNSRFLFLFGMNISKLKTAVFKKFDKKQYKSNLLFDAKDRFYKVTYSLILVFTLEERVDVSLYLTILKALAFSSAIDYLRNLTILALAGELSYIRELRAQLMSEVYLRQYRFSRHQSIMKCFDLDFTVVPYILFLLKFAHIIFKQIRKLDFNLIATSIFFLLAGFTVVVRFGMFVARRIHQRALQAKDSRQLVEI